MLVSLLSRLHIRKHLANKFLLLIEWHKRIIINTRLYVNLSRKGPCIICTFTFHFLIYLGNKCRLFFAVIILCLYMCQTCYVTKNANIPQEKCFHRISFFTKTTPTALETRHAVKNTGHISQLQTVGSIYISFANKQCFLHKSTDLMYYILRFYPRNIQHTYRDFIR